MEANYITIIFIIVIVFITSCFIAKKIIEKRIESIIRNKKSLLPFEIKEYNYSIFSRTLVLYNVNLEYKFENNAHDTILLSAKKVIVKNLNPLLGRKGNEIPNVFKKMTIHELVVALHSDKNPIVRMQVEKYTVWNYAHNIFKHIQEYKANPLSEEFFSSVLNINHNGIEKRETLFTFYNKETSKESTLYYKRAYLTPMNNVRHLSVIYENIIWSTNLTTFESGKVKIDDLAIPSPKDLSKLAMNFQSEIRNSNSSIWHNTIQKILDFK